jgi:signal transduction histidine kinase
VIDTGGGIPADAVDKVFQAYYSTKKGGTGLGLPMASRIAAEHGGKLSVRSEPGKGSDFTLRLPLKV